jgi:hypothetical protein
MPYWGGVSWSGLKSGVDGERWKEKRGGKEGKEGEKTLGNEK